MVAGAIHRHLVQQDLLGYLRLDILRAAGVTFSDRPHHAKPGQKIPTFELLMGRAPVDLLGRTAKELERVTEPTGLPESLKGLTLEERREKAARAVQSVAAVQARKALKQTAKMG